VLPEALEGKPLFRRLLAGKDLKDRRREDNVLDLVETKDRRVIFIPP
jgi:hypothetical protein